MSKAKCTKCGGSAIGDTFEQARNNINHAVGLGRGIKCGDSYGCVTEIKDTQPSTVTEKPKEIPKTEPPTVVATKVESTVETKPKAESPKFETRKLTRKKSSTKYL